MKRVILAMSLAFLSAPAWGQAVTLDDLRGATIIVSAVHDEKLIRGGQPMTVQLTTNGQIRVGDSKQITSQFQATSNNLTTGRSRTGQTRTNSGTLDTPTQGAQGYDLLWTFVNGSLVRLRVYSGGQGAGKMTISFRRAANGLSCSFAMPMAREVGVGRIAKGSQIDQAPIEILEFRQISTSCQVSKG
jgi:hypothetical protein